MRKLFMKILLIGDFSNNFDEGFKNIAKYTYQYLSKKYDVKTLNIKQILSVRTVKTLKESKPDIIHYFTAPTLSSFILIKILSIKYPKSKIIISALYPKFSLFLRNKRLKSILKFILKKPDAILYQNDHEVFKDISKNVIFFPNYVDINKFKPVTEKEKLELREKYDIEKNKFVILHVGHLSKKRNLEVLSNIQKLNKDYQVVIVAGTYVYKDEELLFELQKKGCKVIVGYVDNLQEIYTLSDCYVFPVPWGNTISIPLTILEAMACNLPIITLRYPTFSIYEEGNGLYFVNDVNEIPDKIKELESALENGIEIKTREKVLSYSLENMTEKLEKIYKELIERGI